MPPFAHASSRFRCSTVLLALALAACGGDTITDGVTDSAFVAAMAELERVERTPGMDSSARVAARTAALQSRGLTRAQVEAAASALADDPERALAIYRAIERKASGDTSAARVAPSPAAARRR